MGRIKQAPTVVDKHGRPIALTGELGRGGEGTIYGVHGQPSHVVKIYHKPPSKPEQEKIEAMVALRAAPIERLAAWPIGTVHVQHGGAVSGLVMPRIDGNQIHSLYGPKSRLNDYPSAGWAFLIHASANLARAFSVIHAAGHVIGDVNHGNVLVSQNATVGLIDCDSFQITSNGRRFLCTVGMQTHTPPELQGQPFTGVVRTSNHDAFGLAVLIFQLLFMGRHPFSGRFLGADDMPLERAISQYRFAYGDRATSRQMQQPPATLPLSAVSTSVGALFEQAFGRDGAQGRRPTADNWISALDAMRRSLSVCDRSSAHEYLRTLSACPWCSLESQSGTLLFNVVVTGDRNVGSFSLDAIWKQITSVRDPGSAPVIQGWAGLNRQPDDSIVLRARHHRRIQAAGGGVSLVVLFLAIGIPTTLAAGFWLLCLGLISAFIVGRISCWKDRSLVQRTLSDRLAHVASQQDQWGKEASGIRFAQKREELKRIRTQYLGIQAQRQRRLKELSDNRQQDQFRRHLSSRRIDQLGIADIGPTRAATLQSYGIETAVDVTEDAVLAVPGFGPSRTAKLLTWRRAVERTFVFDPNKSISPTEIAAVEREIAEVRIPLERSLLNGPQELQQMNGRITQARETLRGPLERTMDETAQAYANTRPFRFL